MFSGIIGYRGTVVTAEHDRGGERLRVACEGALGERPRTGDSIAIDGVCLTAIAVEGENVDFDVVPETLARSTLGARAAGDLVNVEYALRAGDRLGGHLVYGHVDRSVAIVSLEDEGQGKRARLERPDELAFALCEKAFVALDGVSLTIAACGDGWFEVVLIPETLARTTLGLRRAGEAVNLEIDPFAHYARAALDAMQR